MTKECIKTTCPYCGVGCGVEVSQLGILGDSQHPANFGALCVKGSALAQSLEMPSRLLYPKLNGEEISWDEATDIIAHAYHQAIETDGPNSTAMYVSGQILTEDYYVANKFMKGFVGSANIDTNSRLCMSSAVVAHNRAFGEDVVPVNYDDIDEAELIIICGANTAWTHPVLFRRIQNARERNPKLKIVVIDPRETVTAQQADLHLAIPNDGDIPLFEGLLRHCIDTGNVNERYMAEHTVGAEALLKHLAAQKHSAIPLSQVLKIPVEQLQIFFDWFSSHKKVITLFCQGVNQSEVGSDKGNAIINAHLATGKLGYKGAGPFSITGQPNAMGGREVGGLANQLAIHRGFDTESLSLVSDFWQTSRLATGPGLKAIEMFEAVERGDIKVIWIMATNPVVSMPDNQYIKRALEKCPLVIVSDVTPDADIAQHANLLLPAAGWGEKQGMVTNSERMLSRQRRFIELRGEIKPDWRAISEVGSKLCNLVDQADGFQFASEADVFREYAAMTGLNKGSHLLLDLSRYAEVSDEEYQSWQPTRWGHERPFSDGRFSFPDGKARFIVPQNGSYSATAGWRLNTGRQRDQWHTMTRTGHISHLAVMEPEPTLYMSSESAAYLGVKAGELVSLNSKNDHCAIMAKMSIDEGLLDKQLFMSMHWAGHYGQGNKVNAVVSRAADPYSGQPAFKSQEVDVMVAGAKTYGLYLGEKFDKEVWPYCSYQVDDSIGVWRVASFSSQTKPFTNSTNTSNQLRKLTLELVNGWLAVNYDEQEGLRRIRSIFITSTQPITSDSGELAKLVGQPLTFNTLLSIAAQEQPVEMVCSCLRVKRNQIVSELESGDCQNLGQLQQKLKCGTNCGSCIPEIEQLILEHGHIAELSK